MTYPSFSKLLLLLLTLTALSFTSCDDDDDVLGIDLTDDGTLFMSSNTTGLVGVLDVNDNPLEVETFASAGMDADGIYYDDSDEMVFQVIRSNSTLVNYKDVLDDLDDPNGVDVVNTSTSDFTNGRGLVAIGNSQFVVAQDASAENNNTNAIVIYGFSENSGFTLAKTIPTDFNLWGLEFVDGTVYAVVDNSDSIAVFNNLFDTPDGQTATPDRYIRVDGLVRTHGIAYNEQDDLMVLTDVGAADSDSDGAIFIISNFSTRSNDVFAAADYVRIGGANTRLGNPVDVDYDPDDDRIFVAERLRGGGELLIFQSSATGNTAPIETIPFAGISSLYLNRD
ncbi:hypothetical protein QWY85_17570 [Neolewinella lacunae]|uniref:Uncharacterized protein n=1 Tax=Neolewinella lacunae TaxID=1517758 RepID=A0A923PS80_9BACT|nr:hypothetical protein [Neolewinella lacunae]MBC6995827.1 hypothetical protein [Neolewinella lacunae]MDN3636480.1 hypothetical protein [Neolewinella lacunae]